MEAGGEAESCRASQIDSDKPIMHHENYPSDQSRLHAEQSSGTETQTINTRRLLREISHHGIHVSGYPGHK